MLVQFDNGRTDLLPHGAARPESGQLWRHWQGLGAGAGIGDAGVMMGPRGHGAAHLLSQEHGAVRQSVGFGARLRPQRDFLGQQLLSLEKRSFLCGHVTQT